MMYRTRKDTRKLHLKRDRRARRLAVVARKLAWLNAYANGEG